MYSIIFETVAFEDIAEAKRYYRHVSDQLADRFQSAISQCVKDLKKNPYLFQKRIGESRFLKVGIFPYVIVYTVEGKTVIIDAAFATKQDPKKLTDKI